MSSLTKFFKRLLPKKKLTLNDVVEVSEKDGLVTVEVKADILLKVDGSVVNIAKDYIVSIAKEIHLNPPLKTDRYDENFDTLSNDIEMHKIKKLSELNYDKECKCNHE